MAQLRTPMSRSTRQQTLVAGRQHATVDQVDSAIATRDSARRDGRAHPRDHRAEDDPRALRRPARHAQRRSRAIRRRSGRASSRCSSSIRSMSTFQRPSRRCDARGRPGTSTMTRRRLSRPDLRTARSTAIDARVSADSRNVSVRAEFANPDHRLLPGMFANIDGRRPARPAEVLTLPRTAIVYSLYGDNVFVVEARRRPKAGEAQAATGDDAPRASSSSAASCVSATITRRAGRDPRGRQGGRARGDRRARSSCSQFARVIDRRRRRAAAARRRRPSRDGPTDERLHRSLHPPAGARHRRQPARSC